MKNGCFAIFIIVLMTGCSTLTETVISDPPGATIYWGKNTNSVKNTGYITPYSRQVIGANWETWCYKVTKDGYFDSEIACMPEQTQRTVSFHLKDSHAFADNAPSLNNKLQGH